jgi:molybdopterin-guanine dinucleotide biosynthesis protein A
MTSEGRPARSTAGVSGIVLAGGRSSRFGGDKLAARYADRPLLDRAVDALAPHSSEVVVVLAPGDDRPLPQSIVPVRRATDPELHGGPLVGLLAGLEAASEPVVLVSGGDMPTMSDAVLAALVRALTATEGAAEAALLVRRGVPQPLPAAIRNGAATETARRLLADGERSLFALFRSLPVRHLAEGEWRGLDPEGATLHDVDEPGDLGGRTRRPEPGRK